MSPVPQVEPKAAEFTAIFESNLGYVWSSLRRLGVHERDLEDVAHEVFLKVYAELDRLDRARPIKPWLFAFAVRLASDYRKLARHKTALFGDDDPSRETTAGADEALVALEREQLLHRALDTLDLEKRAVFVLAELDEVPMPEVARALEIPLNTGYSRLRVARQEVTAAVRRLGRQGGSP